MTVITKILLSIAILCGGSFLITAIRMSGGPSGGIAGFIILPAIIAGFWAVWKYNPEKKNEDKHTLNKD